MTQPFFEADWQDCLCEDLRPVMQHLQERHRVTGWRADTDRQQRWSRIYLNKNISSRLVARVKEQFANSPQVLFFEQEIRCTRHQVRLLPKRMWNFEHGIKRQSVLSFLVEMFVTLLLIIGGFFSVYSGTQKGDTWEIVIGIAGILLFGLSFRLNVRELVRYLRRKWNG